MEEAIAAAIDEERDTFSYALMTQTISSRSLWDLGSKRTTRGTHSGAHAQSSSLMVMFHRVLLATDRSRKYLEPRFRADGLSYRQASKSTYDNDN